MNRVLWVLPLLAVICVGCSKGGMPNSARISGTITYKGKDGVEKPVTAGTIMLLTKVAGNYPLPIRPDGTYSGTDIPVGEIVVTIETESANPKNKTPDYGGSAKGKGPSGSPRPDNSKGGQAGAYVEIPKKYVDKNTSGLTMTLTAGSQKKDFQLTD